MAICLKVTGRSPWRCYRQIVCKAFSDGREIKIPKKGWTFFFVLTLNEEQG